MRSLMKMRRKTRLEHIGKSIYVMPGFIHDIGDEFHHESMMRTCKRDEYGGPIPGTGVPDWRYMLHEFLDDYFFYPLRKFLNDNEACKIHVLDHTLVSFLWGLNCGFPLRDVVLYVAWELHGCKPIQVFDKGEDGLYRQSYPTILTS